MSEFEKWWAKEFVSEFEGVTVENVENAWNAAQAKSGWISVEDG